MPPRPTSLADLPKSIPIFPLTGALLLPFSYRPLNIFEPRYIDLIDAILRDDRLIGLIQPEDTSQESPKEHSPLQAVGCIGRLTHFEESEEGRYFVVLEGITRFRLIQELKVPTSFRRGVISADEFASDFTRNFGEEDVDRVRFVKMMRDYADYANIELNWDEIEKAGTADLINFCCMAGPYGPIEKQALLEARTLEQRAETLIAMTEYEIARGAAGGIASLN